MYKLPHKFSSIEEKELIESDADFQAWLELFKNPDEFPPELYIWNYEEESPKKLPIAKKDRDCSSGTQISPRSAKRRMVISVCAADSSDMKAWP